MRDIGVESAHGVFVADDEAGKQWFVEQVRPYDPGPLRHPYFCWALNGKVIVLKNFGKPGRKRNRPGQSSSNQPNLYTLAKSCSGFFQGFDC